MTKPKPKAPTVVAAVEEALAQAEKRRGDGLKPIEIVKIAISAYQAYVNTGEAAGADAVMAESDDRSGLRRGTQASVDRLLFNVNYWRAAYEDRVVEACETPEDARACLKALHTWSSHTMKLNTLSAEEGVGEFERFCPPLITVGRGGKGPVSDFASVVERISETASSACAQALEQIAADMQAEAVVYENMSSTSPLDAYYELLPVWCLQGNIDLVTGTWLNDKGFVDLVIAKLRKRFSELGYGAAPCDYFFDSATEAIDNYQASVTAECEPWHSMSVASLLSLVHDARTGHPTSEVDGYGDALPAWLSSMEQLIWNLVVCPVYGPGHARPLLAGSVDLLPEPGRPVNVDAMTDMAQRAYARYKDTRQASGVTPEFESFDQQPDELRQSGLARVEDIPFKLNVLGYRIVPLGSCYPDQRIEALRASEIECLAILEHRRWYAERVKAGWEYAPVKDVVTKTSPYLVDWDELPDRAREWNRSAVRDIPALLAAVGLTIAK